MVYTRAGWSGLNSISFQQNATFYITIDKVISLQSLDYINTFAHKSDKELVSR